MKPSKHIEVVELASVTTQEARDSIGVGQWYWYETGSKKREKRDMPGGGGRKLMCVTHIGSNYIKLETPLIGGRCSSIRVHMDDFWSKLEYEPNSSEMIGQNILRLQKRISGMLSHINRMSNQIGVSSTNRISHQLSDSRGLAVMSDSQDIENYKRKAIFVRNKLLPKMHDRLKKENEILTGWMSAEGIALKASIMSLSTTKEAVDERVFNVSIYAGLSEHVSKIMDGQPAGVDEKIHVFQRMAYMDEESLLDYRAGGMEFSDIADFDEWLARPENTQRILPFPRCVIAFQVRRNIKDRSDMSAIARVKMAISDKYTFLYVRNGDQLFRVTLDDFDFGEKLFPDADQFDPSEPMMAKMFGYSVQDVIPLREYEAMLANYEAEKKSYLEARDQWFSENPFESWKESQKPNNQNEDHWRRCCEPKFMNTSDIHRGDYQPFDRSSVYFDDIRDFIHAKTNHFNRMALILQGLIDRSEVFSPHRPIQAWNPADFNDHFKLIYDASLGLYYGEPLSFEEYRQSCNQKIDKDSVFVGQNQFWMNKVQRKEQDRLDRKSYYSYDTPVISKNWKPEGNEGPVEIGRAKNLRIKSQKATFQWERELVAGSRAGEKAVSTITIPFDDLLNVSAYKLGDYKKFFQDPRTRQAYLKWAPMLLAAEDYKQFESEFDVHNEEE